jgi:hypothetical protein
VLRLREHREVRMEALESINQLNGALVVGCTENAWGPSGTLEVANLRVVGANASFDLLVPTSLNDVWDYIWRSERELGSTDKVQLFQSGTPVSGSQITAISREGKDERWDAIGPEQYRLTFVVPLAAVQPDTPIEVRFFWAKNLMSTALGASRENE